MRLTHILIRSAFLIALSSQAYAYGSRYSSYGASSEEEHLLSVGGGISSPSLTSALGENPAGLTNNRTSKFLLEGASGNDQLNPLGYGGGFYTGNGSVGGGILLQGFNSQTNGVSGSILLLNWGIAVDFPTFDMAWGFTGTHALSRSGDVHGTGSGTTWCVDSGIIFNPHGRSRLGFTLFQILDSIDAVGAGYSLDPTPWATFTVDASYTTSVQTTVVKPALALHISSFQMASGYGVRVAGDNWSWIRQGLSLAIGMPLGRTLSVQAYYNQLALYYAALTVSL